MLASEELFAQHYPFYLAKDKGREDLLSGNTVQVGEKGYVITQLFDVPLRELLDKLFCFDVPKVSGNDFLLIVITPVTLKDNTLGELDKASE
nr:hypothetical protein [Bacilli bacterium]